MPADMKIAVDTVWTLFTAFLVFFMNAGFACVESGFCRSKNTVNILSKNFIVFAISTIAFWAIGWGLMFGNGTPYFGLEGLFGISGADNSPMVDGYVGAYSSIAWTGIPLFAKFFFQLVFAGTAATIVSGAVAERIKYISFILFSFLLVGLIYPVVGHWLWGGGFLAQLGAWDFAGSTVVHSVGGWAALAGVLMLGPRFGKYRADGSANVIPGHSLPIATIGTFILWLGWFGFNPGSTMAADPGAIALIAVNTNFAAAAAILSATLTSWLLMKKPDLGMTLNGCLAGLVAITAPCAWVTPASSMIIGLIAGVLVVIAVVSFDRVHVDDPVGATSVHLVNGIWGTLSIGLFAVGGGAAPAAGLFNGGGMGQLGAQAIAVAAAGAFTFIASIIAWSIVKVIVGLRVDPEEEIRGLDIGEHGNSAYPEFVTRKFALAGSTVTTGGNGSGAESKAYAASAR